MRNALLSFPERSSWWSLCNCSNQPSQVMRPAWTFFPLILCPIILITKLVRRASVFGSNCFASSLQASRPLYSGTLSTIWCARPDVHDDKRLYILTASCVIVGSKGVRSIGSSTVSLTSTIVVKPTSHSLMAFRKWLLHSFQLARLLSNFPF